MQMETTIVLYPSPPMGHLISMVELATFILRHHPSFSITILTAPSSADYIATISATLPTITFHHLPPIHLNPEDFPTLEALLFESLRLTNPHVRRALESISRSTSVSAFIVDFFCSAALPIAAKLDIPTYFFFPTGAAFLALFLYFPYIHKAKSVKDIKNTLLHVPGIPPFLSSHMPVPMRDQTTSDYQNMLDMAINLPNSAGFLVNTFERFEIEPLKAIREGRCHPDGHTPPVFCVGPLVADGGAAVHDCLNWLDEQPSKSVIYLSFGSSGFHSPVQLKEIAQGLEKTGRRFLWVVRSSPAEGDSALFGRPPEPDLDALLPTGFLDRTKDRGLVVKSWAPQVAVLRHESVGGFVTHCGWNSVLEAVRAAVPMVAWPLYAEQHFNRDVIVEEMRVALRMVKAEDGFVAAEEVAERVKELMELEKGREVRKVVEEMRSEGRAAMAKGGSSIDALGKLAHLWKSIAN